MQETELKEGHMKRTKGWIEKGRLILKNDDELHEDAIAFKVVGNCMAPDIIDRDCVVCDPHASCHEGDIVAFHHCRKGLLVKRLMTIEGEHYFLANDASITPIKVSEDCKLLGKVVRVVYE